jgi:hypothetical protein
MPQFEALRKLTDRTKGTGISSEKPTIGTSHSARSGLAIIHLLSRAMILGLTAGDYLCLGAGN